MADTCSVSSDAPIAAIRSRLEECRRVLVVSHIDPDGDALGTQLACANYLRSMGKEVFLYREASLPGKYEFLPGADAIDLISEGSLPDNIDTALILECPLQDRIGRAVDLLDERVTKINIDHHRDNRMYGEINWVDTRASSVGEMVYEYFCEVGYDVTADDATNLYVAIMTDTGRFRFSSTTGRTMKIAGMLIDSGADPTSITEEVYYKMKPSTLHLFGLVLSGIEFHNDQKACLLQLTLDALEQSGATVAESEGLVDHTLFAESALVGALLKERPDNEARVSFRSRGDINVADVARRFGGGGHFNAAGCTIQGSLDEVRRTVLQVFAELLEEHEA